MASTYSTNLKIELIGTGEQSGTWGSTTNTNLGTALEEAIVGRATATFATDADLTLTLTNTNATQVARAFALRLESSVSLTATRNLIVPAINKPYIINNQTTGGQSIVVKNATGSGVTIPNGKRVAVYNNGTDVLTTIDYVPSLDIGGAATLSGGTANGVLYLNGSKVATSGSALTFDGTTLGTTGSLRVDGNTTLGNASTDTVTVNGYMGIGTSSPGFRLDSQVSSTATNDQQIALRLKSTTTADMISGFGVNTLYSIQDSSGVNFNIAQLRVIRDGADDSGAFVFAPYLSGVSTERLRIDSSGNIGIGTLSPSAKLDVRGLATSTGVLQVYEATGSSSTPTKGIYLTREGGTTGLASPSVYFDVGSGGGNCEIYSLRGGSLGGNLVFGTEDNSGTMLERLRIDSTGTLQLADTNSNGIRFPATQIANANANTLDDYEEGTFTPTIVGATTAGTGTYTTQVGRYTKIGNRVFFTVSITWTAHTGTGLLRISGLPFTVGANSYGLLAVSASNLTYTGQLTAYVVNSTATVGFGGMSSGAAAAAVNVDTAATIEVSGHYEV